MATVFDVARYILERRGRMSAMKLQKLVYYSQAWSLVWDEKPLFPEAIEAWANGPVVRELYNTHRGFFSVSANEIQGNPCALTDDERETVDAVLAFYGDKSAQWLIELTHMESPWQEARKGIPESQRSTSMINHASMADYYSGLV